MAAAQHNPSRRALLGAAVGFSFDTPVRQAHRLLRMSGGPAEVPVHPSGSGEEWEAALVAFEAAEGAVRQIEAATAGYGFEDEAALLPAHEAACEAMEAALGRLLLVPAPHLVALLVKLELFFRHELEPHSVDAEVLAAIKGDARRLARWAVTKAAS
ncbi:MAG: hypothetical protein ACJ8ER_14740 [Allosphingosinicella sp.]